MKKFFISVKNWFIRHKPSKRRLIQLYAALLYNANIKGFVTGNIYQGNSKYACVPGFNCYSCPGAVGACPLGSLQNALASSNTRAPFYVFGILILFGLLLGRTICGFLCPMGLIQDLLYKIKSPKLKKSKITRILSYFKYVLLVAMVIIIPLAYASSNATLPAFCKYICPVGTLEGSVALLVNGNNESFFGMLGPLFTWKFCVMVAIIVGSIFIYRLFCRFLCPLGAIYSFFCKVAMLGVKLDKQKCVDCGLCIQTCKMDIKHVGDHECIHCGECLKVCPTQAISWKGSKIFLHANAIEPAGESASGETVALKDIINGGNVNANVTVVNAENAVQAEIAIENRQFEADEKALAKIEKGREKAQKKAERKAKRGTIAYVKKRNRILEAVAWVVALAVLVCSLVYYCIGFNPANSDAEFIRQLYIVLLPIIISIVLVLLIVRICRRYKRYAETRQPKVRQQKATASGVTTSAANKKTTRGTIAYVKKRNRILEAVAWAVALAVLITALVYYNFIYSPAEAYAVYTVGDTFRDFSLTKFFTDDDEQYTLSDDLDDGKIVILNFWYMGCQPCQQEIPYFLELAADENYADKVSLVIIHAGASVYGAENIVTSSSGEEMLKLERYVATDDSGCMGWGDIYQSATWCLDTDDESSVFSAAGGTSAYPVTVILDSDGVIKFQSIGNVEEEELYSAVDEILSSQK